MRITVPYQHKLALHQFREYSLRFNNPYKFKRSFSKECFDLPDYQFIDYCSRLTFCLGNFVYKIDPHNEQNLTELKASAAIRSRFLLPIEQVAISDWPKTSVIVQPKVKIMSPVEFSVFMKSHEAVVDTLFDKLFTLNPGAFNEVWYYAHWGFYQNQPVLVDYG